MKFKRGSSRKETELDDLKNKYEELRSKVEKNETESAREMETLKTNYKLLESKVGTRDLI